MRTIILGFDAFDPARFEELAGKGQLPNLSRFAEQSGDVRFRVSNPPQSEVSWTSIATGLNPGEHGLFDFVHRDPRNYGCYLSLLPTRKGLFGGVRFRRPSRRETIFDEAARQGYPATALWWPAMFPAEPSSSVQVIPGLGTPDIQGRLGVGTLYTAAPSEAETTRKIARLPLEQLGPNRYRSSLVGPSWKNGADSTESTVEFHLVLDREGVHSLILEGQRIDLHPGEWSPILEGTFQVGRFWSVKCIFQTILTGLDPVTLYVSPLQIHPLKPIWPLGSPKHFVKRLWRKHGPFPTLGWPQDTTALEEGCLSDDQFLALCDRIFHARRHIVLSEVRAFREGFLAAVFDSLDRVQHMFWSRRPDLVDEWYRRLDALVGEVEEATRTSGLPDAAIFVVSDHGFTDFDYKVHLNRWLLDQNYLIRRNDGGGDDLSAVDWSSSRCFAVGLNSLYVNLSGREARGQVSPDQASGLLPKVIRGLTSLKGPDGKYAISRVWTRREAFWGAFEDQAPDLLVGYAPGYRASSETGLGQFGPGGIITSNRDHWSADHCIDAGAVPGVLFSNRSLVDWPKPSYLEFPAIVMGKDIQHRAGKLKKPPPLGTPEDEEAMTKRLESLGYL